MSVHRRNGKGLRGRWMAGWVEGLEERRLLAAVPQVVWSSYFGGEDKDVANAIAVDASGNTYVAGRTYSAGWVSGGQDTSYGGLGDGFIAKISSNGSLAWASYLGGGGEDVASSVAVDQDGTVYVAGTTRSSGWVGGGLSSTRSGYVSAFVAKIRPDGSLVWSGYLGNSDDSGASAIAVSSLGDVYVAGSLAAGDAFVAKVDHDGTLQWLNALGGNAYDYANAVAVDGSGNALVAGGTYSAGWTVGGFDTTLDGFSDGFVAKLDRDGRLVWSSYIGGRYYDYANALVLGHAGDICVAGLTGSPGWVSGGSDTTHNGSDDAFVAKLRMDGTLVWSTHLGGPNSDRATAIAIDDRGDLYVAGTVHPIDLSSRGYDSDYKGLDQGFPATISSDGTVGWMTSVGHSGYNQANGVTIDGAGVLYVAGQAYYSGDARLPYRGGINAYVVKLAQPGTVANPDTINGSDGNDNIRISAVDVTQDGQIVQGIRVAINGVEYGAFVPSGMVEVRGLGGDDRIEVDPSVTIPIVICGGMGNDSIVGGSGSDLVEGGEGDDTLVGGGGNDTLYGHDGADWMDGGAGDDELYGNPGNDTMHGGEGNDLVYGQGDDDVLYGNGGRDTLSGADGQDELRGGLGEDSLLGGLGNDSLYGGDGSDTISGGDGADYIEGKGKADTIYGGTGNDTIYGEAGADWIAGEDGDDWIDVAPSAGFRDSVDGGTGTDTVRADGDDLLDGVEVLLLG